MFFFSPGKEQLSDEDLIRRYRRSRDHQWAGELYQRYTHLVFGVSMKILKNEEDCKDAVMDIFDHLLESLLTYDITNFRSWLYSVTRNHCLSLVRRSRRITYADQPPEELGYQYLIMEDDHSPYCNHNGREIDVDDLEQAMARIPADQRACLQLFFLDGHSYRHIAELTGMPLNMVKSNIQNGKRNLRNLLNRKE